MAITNGGFETGDLTGWTNEDSGGSSTVTTGAKRNGTYGLRQYGSVTSPAQAYPLVTRTDIPVNFTSITFYYKVNELTGATPNCYLDVYLISDEDFWAEVFEVHNPAAGDFIRVTKTRQEIMTDNGMSESDWGTTPLKLQLATTVSTTGGTAVFEVFIDDVSYTTGFVNGDFEIGDLTGWSGYDTNSYGASHSASMSIDAASKRTGGYGAYYCVEAWDATSGAYYTLEQTVTLAEFSTISFWYKVASATIPDDPIRGLAVMMTYHNGSEEERESTLIDIPLFVGNFPNGWMKVVVNKAEFLADVAMEGGHVHATSKFKIILYLESETTGMKELLVYVDDVVMDSPAAGELTNGNFASGLGGWFPNCAKDCTYPPTDVAYTVEAGSGDAVLHAEGNFYDSAVAGICQEMTTDFVSVSFSWRLEDTELDSWCNMLVQFLAYTAEGYPVWVTPYFEWIETSPSFATLTITKTEVETAMGWDARVWGTSTAIRIALYLRPVS